MMMRIKREPKKPERKTITQYIDNNACRFPTQSQSFITFIEKLKDEIVTEAKSHENVGTRGELVDITIKDNGGWYDQEVEVTAHYKENDVSFNERLRLYDQKLAEYRSWYEENKEAIKEERERRKKEKKCKLEEKMATLEEKKAKLEEKKRKIEMQLNEV
jgi:hypothetical protein